MLLGVIVTLADVVMQLYAEENCSGISTLISRAYAQCLTFSFLFNSLLMSSRMYRKKYSGGREPSKCQRPCHLPLHCPYLVSSD